MSDPEEPNGLTPDDPTEPSERLLARVSVDFFLESAIAMSDLFDGDYLRSIIFLAVARENLRAVSYDQDLARHRSGDAVSADPPLPASVYSISKILGLNYETTRRHIGHLVRAGFCEQTKAGIVVPEEVLKRADLLRANTRSVRIFQKFASDLREVGLTF